MTTARHVLVRSCLGVFLFIGSQHRKYICLPPRPPTHFIFTGDTSIFRSRVRDATSSLVFDFIGWLCCCLVGGVRSLVARSGDLVLVMRGKLDAGPRQGVSVVQLAGEASTPTRPSCMLSPARFSRRPTLRSTLPEPDQKANAF
jgi:hypothetical protein